MPVLILQPIVENAVKYGVAKSRKPVTVRISAYEEAGHAIGEMTESRCRHSAGPFAYGTSKTRTSPLSGFSSPMMCLSVTLFPEPE